MTLLTPTELACLEELRARFRDRGALLTHFTVFEATIDLHVACPNSRWMEFWLSRAQMQAADVCPYAAEVVHDITTAAAGLYPPMLPLSVAGLDALMLALAPLRMVLTELEGMGGGDAIATVLHTPSGWALRTTLNLAFLSLPPAQDHYIAIVAHFCRQQVECALLNTPEGTVH